MAVGARTHYELLGVDPAATHDEVRRAFRRQARLHHPDAAAPRAGGGEAMAAITEAWEVLGDPVRRAAYDAGLGRPPPAWAPGAGDDLEDLEDLEDLPPPFAEPDHDEAPSRPADLLVALPVVLVLVAAASFGLGVMWRVEGMRTLGILLVPLTVAAFATAPLFSMLRSRNRHRGVPRP